MSSTRIEALIKAQGRAKRGKEKGITITTRADREVKSPKECERGKKKGRKTTTRAGREVKSPKECDCGFTSEDERELNLEFKRLRRHERERAAFSGGSSFFGRASDSPIVPVVSSALSNLEAPMSPRVKRLRDELRKEDCYVSPSKTEVTHRTPQGSPDIITTITPERRKFVSSVKMVVVRAGEEEKVAVKFFQTASSAKRCKKEAFVTPDEIRKVRAACIAPDSLEYTIDRDPVTKGRLASIGKERLISKQHKRFRAPVVAKSHGFDGAFEHSHLEARRHGQREAVGSSSGIDSDTDRYITFPARREHNSMRLVTAEISAAAECIKTLGQLYYSDTVTLVRDEEGNPVPVIEREEVTWADEAGNELHFKFDALNGVTPAKQLAKVSGALYLDAFFENTNRKLFVDEDSDREPSSGIEHSDREPSSGIEHSNSGDEDLPLFKCLNTRR